MAKHETEKRKKYLMIDDKVPDKVSNKIKEMIGIEKLDYTIVLIDTYE